MISIPMLVFKSLLSPVPAFVLLYFCNLPHSFSNASFRLGRLQINKSTRPEIGPNNKANNAPPASQFVEKHFIARLPLKLCQFTYDDYRKVFLK
jgi:hypothetical protein